MDWLWTCKMLFSVLAWALVACPAIGGVVMAWPTKGQTNDPGAGVMLLFAALCGAAFAAGLMHLMWEAA